MKKLLILLLFSQIIYAQKTYKFDYILEYRNKIDSTKLISNPTYLINPKANNYYILIHNSIKKDTLSIGLQFGDMDLEKNSVIYSDVSIRKFNENESISVTCEAMLNSSSKLYKEKAKEYFFEILKDTIIDSVAYYHYTIKSKKSVKYQKRNKISQFHYIVDKNASSFLPFFDHPTVYETWKLDKNNIPNGILKIKYTTNWEHKITNKWVLEKITPIKKEVIIPENCD